MAYIPMYGQPYPYQDQLSQLRNVPPQGQFSPQYNRPDPSGLTWVQGEASAKSWIVAPGSTVLLMDSEAQRFYLKSADMSGIPAMRIFEYKEVSLESLPQPTEAPKFVRMDEFSRFQSEVMGKLAALSADA